MGKLGAMRNMSPGQTLMQARIGQNQAMGGVNQQWMKSLQDRFTQGSGLMSKMTGIQQGLDENVGNAYLSNLNMRNQFAQDQQQGGLGGLLGGFQLGQKMDFSNLGELGEGGFSNFMSQLFQGGG